MSEQMVGVEIIGLRDTRGRFASAEAVISDRMAAELGGALREILARYREAAPKSKDGGEHEHPDGGTMAFSDSFSGDITKDGPTVEASVVTSQPTLRQWIREGTSPHEIVPVIKKALSFNIGEDGIVVTRVDHPGTRANHWEDPIETEATLILDAAGARVGAQVVASLAGEP